MPKCCATCFINPAFEPYGDKASGKWCCATQHSERKKHSSLVNKQNLINNALQCMSTQM